MIFVDPRDHEGLMQVICDPDRPKMLKVAEDIRNKFCLQVKNVIHAHPEGATSVNLTGGKVEVLCHELAVFNTSVTPPFQLDDDSLSKITRLTHHVPDLHHPQMQYNLYLHYRITMEIRKCLDDKGLIDIGTPILTRGTPGGARDYLASPCANAGQFFTLPQSPRLFK